MNYLAHAFLSPGSDDDLLTGNMIADHVKGRLALEQLPPGIQNGILLHRKIDEKTDAHPATLRARLLFRRDYGLYSGPITDTLYDHFLACDPAFFPTQNALLLFTRQIYRRLQQNEAYFPPKFAAYFPNMVQHNWLYNYRPLKGVERSLLGLSRKALYMPPIAKAYDTFITHYYLLSQCYHELIADMVGFVKFEAGS